jgi:hypothetical protein
MADAFRSCACAPATCATDCAASFCAPNGGGEDSQVSDACFKCIGAKTAACPQGNSFSISCPGSPECDAIEACMKTAQCGQ